MNLPQCSVISLTDTELMALVRCAARRLVVIAPGLSESVARALADVWRRLGPDAVQIVLDSDPEVCRLGFGEVAALEILRQTAEELETAILQQQGLRVGVVITDETTTIYSPTSPRSLP
jgi:F420-0:gamma-glutamyl ligase-like protein